MNGVADVLRGTLHLRSLTRATALNQARALQYHEALADCW